VKVGGKTRDVLRPVVVPARNLSLLRLHVIFSCRNQEPHAQRRLSQLAVCARTRLVRTLQVNSDATSLRPHARGRRRQQELPVTGT